MKYFNDFFVMMIILINPLFQTFVGTGIFRNLHIKVFEINLLEGYFNITFSKTIAVLISYKPFLCTELIIMFLFNITYLFVPLIFSSLVAVSVSLLLSISSNTSFSSMALAIYLFLFPTSVEIFIQSLFQLYQHADLITSAIAYIFNPFIAVQYWKSGLIVINPFYGYLIDSFFIVFLYGIYMFISFRLQIKP
jgi:hypothetical protein